MEQKKIGGFIAVLRKEMGLTQAERGRVCWFHVSIRPIRSAGRR